MVWLLLTTEKRGMQVSDIATLINKALPYRMSVQRLSNIMRPALQDGRIDRHYVERKMCWRLAYEPDVETQ